MRRSEKETGSGPENGSVHSLNAVQQTLTQIWKETLELEEIGLKENFFELGGHSLLAMSVQHKIVKAFNIDLKMPHFFQNPTIAELAQIILKELSESDGEA